MTSLLTACGLGLAVFVATNVDDLFLLLAFFADPGYRARQVVLGQFLGIGALTVLSLGLALAAAQLPAAWVGLLGLAPIAIGVKQLLALREAEEAEERPASRAAVLTITAITIANGGDNLGVWVPLFSTRTALELIAIVSTFGVLTGAWCAAGWALVRHPAVGPRIRRPARILTPVVLIGLGVLILVEARVWTLLL